MDNIIKNEKEFFWRHMKEPAKATAISELRGPDTEQSWTFLWTTEVYT